MSLRSWSTSSRGSRDQRSTSTLAGNPGRCRGRSSATRRPSRVMVRHSPRSTRSITSPPWFRNSRIVTSLTRSVYARETCWLDDAPRRPCFCRRRIATDRAPGTPFASARPATVIDDPARRSMWADARSRLIPAPVVRAHGQPTDQATLSRAQWHGQNCTRYTALSLSNPYLERQAGRARCRRRCSPRTRLPLSGSSTSPRSLQSLDRA